MAGIVGIIHKKERSSCEQLQITAQKMISKLAMSEQQQSDTYMDSNIFVGNVLPLYCLSNNRMNINTKLNLICVIDGLVYVNMESKKAVIEQFPETLEFSDYELLPYLYFLFAEEVTFHLSGWYNIVFYNTLKRELFLINDFFGYLPLFFYEDERVFIFASKIESIIASGYLPKVEFDAVTITEHLFFNYSISDMTYIIGIQTLANATSLKIVNNKSITRKYWSMGELFDSPSLSKNQSFELLNHSLRRSLSKGLNSDDYKINFSLTGGWDSRVILSYLLPDYKDRLNLYSFGVMDSQDIVTPQLIAREERLAYTPIILSSEYLESDFLRFAESTIILSNGTRNYKRSHYLYAIEKMSQLSNSFISGIFGDEVMKIGKPKSGEVLSNNFLKLFESGFDVDETLKLFKASVVRRYVNLSKANEEDFYSRLNRLKREFNQYKSFSERYIAFRFETNLRKYFGYEINGYNDYGYSFSPFIDIDFVKQYAKSYYFGARYDYFSKSLVYKQQTTNLYADLVLANNPKLASYNSFRGYSMSDVKSFRGKLKILYVSKIEKRMNRDEYNTKPTDSLFFDHIASKDFENGIIRKHLEECEVKSLIANNNSLYYWMVHIHQNYMN